MSILNEQCVGGRGKTVTVTLPKTIMTPLQALAHAAWLVFVAESLDPTLKFTDVLDQLKSE